MFCGHRAWLLLVVVLVVSVVAVVGCGKKDSSDKLAEGVAEKTLGKVLGGGAEVDLDGGDVTIKTEDGTTKMSETAEWPSDMFSGVPEFTYGVVERVSRTKDTTSGQTSMTVWLREVKDDALEKYGSDLEGAGWEAQTTMTSGEGGMISAQKGNLGLTVMYNKEDQFAALNVFSAAAE